MSLGKQKATRYSWSPSNTQRERIEKFKKDRVTTERDLGFLGRR